MDGYSGSVVFSPQTFRLRSTDLALSNPSHRMSGAEYGRALPIRTSFHFPRAQTKFSRGNRMKWFSPPFLASLRLEKTCVTMNNFSAGMS